MKAHSEDYGHMLALDADVVPIVYRIKVTSRTGEPILDHTATMLGREVAQFKANLIELLGSANFDVGTVDIWAA